MLLCPGAASVASTLKNYPALLGIERTALNKRNLLHGRGVPNYETPNYAILLALYRPS